MNSTYRCRTCQKNWPTDQMGVGLYGRLKYSLKYCPECNSLCDPIKEVQPPAGFSWHRDDWTRDMLPDGWRPLLLNEPCETGDQVLVEGQWRDGIDTGACMTPRHLPTRTWRPLPGASAETPRTDVAMVKYATERGWYPPMCDIIPIEEARQLERELTSSREECEKLRETCGGTSARERFEELTRVREILLKSGINMGAALTEDYASAVIAQLTANASEIERLRKRLDFLIQHEAYVSHSRDGESCNVWLRWDDEGQEGGPVEGYPQKVYHAPDEAIDAAIAALTPKTDL